MRKFIKILLIVIALFLPSRLWAEKQNESPLSISSGKMTVKGQEDKVFFEGDVLIQKGDVKITAGRAEAILGSTTPAKSMTPTTSQDKAPSTFSTLSVEGGKEIVQIEMTEKVQIQQGDRHVLAQKGIYNAKGSEIVLTGNPEMWEKGYHVKGKTIRFSLTEKRSFVEGSVLTIY